MGFARHGVIVTAASVLLSCGVSSGGAQAAAAGEVAASAAIGDFTLPDAQTLTEHELYRLADASAVVIVTTGNGCPIARGMTPSLKALQAKYGPKGVSFLLLNSNLQDGRDAIVQEAKAYDQDIPILMDAKQQVGEALGVTRTAEAFVINPKTWRVMYHGPVDDRADYGVAKAATHPYAADALDAVLAGKPVPQTQVQSKGCLIDFPKRGQRG